jgi:methionyl-tRNA formyltransferase
MRIAFFGTPEIAVIVLQELEQAGIVPELVVANPDAKIGRKQILTPPPTISWAKERNLATFQPESLKEVTDLAVLTATPWDLFIVVAYGKIMPKWLVELPKHGTINVHPSLLPKLRGASPIRSAILEDQSETGVTIMLMDEKMDHGPLLAVETYCTPNTNWPISGLELDSILAAIGGQLLARTIPQYLSGEIVPKEQDHAKATFCTKITKDMGELEIDPHNPPSGREAYAILLKIQAFAGWPETFFMYQGLRIKIKAAKLDETGKLEIARIVPEGKKEMDFKAYFS